MNCIHIPRRFTRTHWGGTETVILQTCRQLQALGHTARITTAEALADSRNEVIDGVTVERHPYFYPWFGLSKEAVRRLDQKGGNLFSFSLMRSLKREPRLDLLHLHTAKRLGGIVRHVARQRRIPYVISVHGGLLDIPAAEAATFTEPTKGKLEWGKLLGMWVGSRRVFDDAAAILCLGTEEHRLVQARYPNVRAEQFPNGVDPDRFAKGDGPAFRRKYDIPPDVPVVLVMGRIDPQKNQLLAISALADLAREGMEAHLLLVGHVTSDDYEARVRSAIQAAGVAQAVTLIPGLAASSPDLVNAFHAANVFLLPSIHEPFGIVILEAWAASLPVVASNVGGVPSFVTHDVDGLLFPSGDTKAAVGALRAVLLHPERARAIAEAGRRNAQQKFSWSSITARLVRLYEEVIRENPLRK